MPRFVPILLAALALLVPGITTARAGVIFYTDRTLFEAALVQANLIDFEDAALPDELGNSFTIGDATILSTDQSGLFVSGPGRIVEYGSPSAIVGAENSGGITIELAPGFSAIGLEVGGIFEPGVFSYVLEGPGGSLASGSLTVASAPDFNGPNTTFFGWTVDPGTIIRLTIDRTDDSQFVAIDNVLYGAAVPEPASWVLLGLGGLALAARLCRTSPGRVID